MRSNLQSPKHLRDRAEEIRAKADHIVSPEIEKERLLSIAAGFERLAEYAERWEVTYEEWVTAGKTN
jgi:hypothetical protein